MRVLFAIVGLFISLASSSQDIDVVDIEGILTKSIKDYKRKEIFRYENDSWELFSTVKSIENDSVVYDYYYGQQDSIVNTYYKDSLGRIIKQVEMYYDFFNDKSVVETYRYYDKEGKLSKLKYIDKSSLSKNEEVNIDYMGDSIVVFQNIVESCLCGDDTTYLIKKINKKLNGNEVVDFSHSNGTNEVYQYKNQLLESYTYRNLDEELIHKQIYNYTEEKVENITVDVITPEKTWSNYYNFKYLNNTVNVGCVYDTEEVFCDYFFTKYEDKSILEYWEKDLDEIKTKIIYYY